MATLVDTSSPDGANWEVLTTDIDSGIENNGVRWVPSPSAIKSAMKEFDGVELKKMQIAASE